MAMLWETLHHNCDNQTDRSSTQLSLNDAACWNHEIKILLTIRILFKNLTVISTNFRNYDESFIFLNQSNQLGCTKHLASESLKINQSGWERWELFANFPLQFYQQQPHYQEIQILWTKVTRISVINNWPNEPRLKRTPWFLWKQSTLL